MAHPASVPSRFLMALGGSALLVGGGCSSIHLAPGPDAGSPDAHAEPPDAWSPEELVFEELPSCGDGPAAPTAEVPCIGGDCGLISTAELDPPHFRNDRPSISVDASGSPVVLYTIAEGGYHLYVARRGADGAFGSSLLPTAAADAALAITSDGCAYAHLNDGAFGSGLYRIEGDRTELVHYLRDRMVGGGRLVIGPEGSIHAIGYDEADGSGFVARWADGYSERALPGTVSRFSLPGGLAIDSEGTAHAAWQAGTEEGSTALFYMRGEDAPERIADLGTGGLALWGGSVDVVAHLDGAVHVLYGAGTSVALATRRGSWRSETLFEGEDRSTCADAPTDGATCETHQVTWSSLGLVATGDGRALGIASRNQRDSVSRASCGGRPGGGGPPGGCSFAEVSHTSSSALHTVMIAGGEVTTREISPAGGGRIGTVALGPDGHLHIASYDGEGAVQYSELGPVD